MLRTLRAAAASPEIVLGEVDGNVDRVARSLSAAAARGARLIVVPELALSGYAFAGVDEARSSAVQRDDSRFAMLAGVLPPGAVAVVGYAEFADGDLYNSAVVLSAEGALAHYRKAHLWGAEAAVFRPGDTAGALVRTPVGALGVAICYDNEFPEVPRRLALAGADILALPVNWPSVPRPAGEHPPEIIQAMAAARSSRLATVIADRFGNERGIDWTGGTAVIDDDGWVAARPDEEGLAVVDLDLRGHHDKSLPPRNDLFADRRPELYG